MIDTTLLLIFTALPIVVGYALSTLRTKPTNEELKATPEYDRTGILAGAHAAQGEDRARREIQWQALFMEAHKNGLLWVRFLLPESGGVQNAAGLSALRDRAAKRYL